MGKYLSMIILYCCGFLYVANALSVEERLLELERVVKLQGVSLERHEQLIKDQQVIIESYQKEENKLKTRVKTLENEVTKLNVGKVTNVISQNELSFTKEFVNEEDNAEKIGEIENDGKDFTSTKHIPGIKKRDNVRLNPLQKHRMKRQIGNIAFHAYMTGSKCVNDQQVFVFNAEGLDSGNGYNSQEGIYDVPETGHYVFTWTTVSAHNEWYNSEIVINGASKGWIMADTAGDAIGTGSATIVVYVNAGSHVFIRRIRGQGCTAADTYGRMTFSGWKLF